MFEIVLSKGPHDGKRLWVESSRDMPNRVSFPCASELDVISGRSFIGASAVYELDDIDYEEDATPIERGQMSFDRVEGPIVSVPSNQNDDHLPIDDDWLTQAMGSREMRNMAFDKSPDDKLSLYMCTESAGSARVELPMSSTTRGMFRAAVRQVAVVREG